MRSDVLATITYAMQRAEMGRPLGNKHILFPSLYTRASCIKLGQHVVHI